MYRLKVYFFFLISMLFFSCGQTPKERMEAERLHADSVKNARQKMLEAEQKAAARLDSIRHYHK